MKNLKMLREKNKVTLDKLSEELQVNKSTLSRIENGLREAKQSFIEECSKYFKVSTDYLLLGFDKGLLAQLLVHVINGKSYDEFSTLTGVNVEELKDLCERTSMKQPSKQTIEKIIAKNEFDIIVANFELLEAAGYLDEAEELKRLEGARVDFGNEDHTIAAHKDNNEDWTKEELEEIKRFKDFIKSKRKQKK